MVRVHVSSDLCILIKCLREVLRLLVPGSPVQHRDIMLIKAIIVFRLRAEGDFLFAFCSLINIDEAVCHFKTKY